MSVLIGTVKSGKTIKSDLRGLPNTENLEKSLSFIELYGEEAFAFSENSTQAAAPFNFIHAVDYQIEPKAVNMR